MHALRLKPAPAWTKAASRSRFKNFPRKCLDPAWRVQGLISQISCPEAYTSYCVDQIGFGCEN